MPAASAARRLLDSDAPWFVALAATTFWWFCRSMGVSPTVWVDTLYENDFIADCLQDDNCTLIGPGATAGIFHSAGYLHWRVFLEWAGLGPDGTHLVLLGMNALGIALAALAARRLAGRVAAAAVALIALALSGIPMQLNVITDVAPMPFFGNLFLLLAVGTAARPSIRLMVVLGLVCGVMANVYATGLVCVASMAIIALKAPERRAALLCTGLGVFAVSAFLIAPGTWITDAQVLLSRGVVGNTQGGAHRALFSIPAAKLTALATVIWIVAALVRPAVRRQIDVAAAMYIPLFIPLALGTWLGKLDPQDKYCAHVLGASATGVVIPVLTLLRGIWSIAGRPALGAAALWIARLAPYVAIALIAQTAAAQAAPERSESLSALTYRDLERVRDTLSGRHWTLADARQSLKAPDEVLRHAALAWPSGWSAGEPGARHVRASLIRVRRDLVPPGKVAQFEVISEDAAAATLMFSTCTPIDWSSFRACVRKPGEDREQCVQTGIPAVVDWPEPYEVPGLPPPYQLGPNQAHLSLQLPLEFPERCHDVELFMPKFPGACLGRFVPGPGIDVSEQGHHAKLEPGAQELRVEWELGGDQCAEYRGAPPFFFEGDETSVRIIRDIFGKQWP